MSSRYVGGFEDDDSLRLGPSKGSRNRSEFEARGSNRGNGTWVQLKDFHCPAERCPSREPLTWVCKKDEDFVFINEKGKIKCETGKHEADVCQWGWNCGNDYHKGEYIRADYEGFTFAMSQAVQLTDKMGTQWVTALLQELGKQYNQ
ncbi:uncharacterized protein LOC127842230 [Dreissena polymorpha]|uniref:uncharacterized protein LOC127842230 n=1 Tax=Dreissena polymorpha TaxID=45954 RepID=UPI0022641931|nr:uncharacterized protein LOC127842230 [Dreissena polymorpha]